MKPDLSAEEREVLRILTELETATAGEIMRTMQRVRSLTQGTIVRLLIALQQKGLVEATDERGRRFRALVTEADGG